MATDPELADQQQARSYFAIDPDGKPPPAKDVIIPAAPPDPDDPAPRKGDRKPTAAEIDDQRAPRAPPIPPRETPRGDPQEGIDELTRQLERERAERQRADQRAQQATSRAMQAEARYGMAATGMVDSAIEAAQRASEQAAAKYAAAMDIADHRTASQAQIEISDTRANLHDLQKQKQFLQDEAARAQQRPQQQQNPDPSASFDDGERNLRNITAQLEKTGYRKSADWLRAHPDLVRDRDSINSVDGVHGYLVNTLKIPVESKRYFDEMERRLIDGAVDDDPQEPDVRRDSGRPAPRAAAPVSRSAPSLRTGEIRRTIHLTSDQRQHARDVLGMTDEEYADSLADAQDRGKLLGAKR